MKKHFLKLLTSAIVISCFYGTISAQNSFEGMYDEITISGDSAWSTFYDHIQLINNSGQALQLKWIRIESIGPSNWTTSVCDPLLCHPEGTDSASFTLPANAGANDYVNVHFNPNNQGGAGRVKVMVVNEADSKDFIILTYNGTTNGSILPPDTTTEDSVATGLHSIVNSTGILLYPNPIDDYLVLAHLPANSYLLKIESVAGAEIKTIELNSSSRYISTENMSPGIYLARIVDRAGQLLYSRKIIKSH